MYEYNYTTDYFFVECKINERFNVKKWLIQLEVAHAAQCNPTCMGRL